MVIRSMILKEWIKVRWFLLLYSLMAFLTVGYIFIKVRHDFAFHEANNYWYSVLFQGYCWFRYLKYLPLAGGVLLAVAQYFPETVSKRIKLTFHLPMVENKGLLLMMLFGTFCLLVVYLMLLLFFLALGFHFFPAEIMRATVVSVVPWFLAGFGAYYLGALVILEPVWLYRVLYFMAASSFIPLLLINSLAGAYAPANGLMAFLVLMLSISLLFSGYRFRKGEMG